MRPRLLASAPPLALWACAVACNSVLGNNAGHLVDAALDDAALESAPETATATDTGQPPPADASQEAEAPEASPSWDPSIFGANLVLWLDGDHGVTTEACTPYSCVKAWGDRSSYGNNASPPSANAEPIFMASQYNGHGAVRFDGGFTSLAVADVPSLRFANSYAIVGVVTEKAASQLGTIYAKTAATYPYAGPGLWIDYFNQGAGIMATDGRAAAQVDYGQFVLSAQLHLDDGTLRVYGASFDGTVLSLRVDDAPVVTAVVSAAPGSLEAIGKDAYVGGPPNGGVPQIILGDIAEVFVLSESMDDSAWASAHAYMKSKYALP